MMKRLLYIAFISLQFAISAAAQNAVITAAAGVQGRISGNGRTLGFATVALLSASDSAVVRTTLSDTAGAFTFNTAAGAYLVEVNYLGYNRYLSDKIYLQHGERKDLGEINMLPKASSLKEITVRDRKALFERKPDRLVLNLQNNLIAAGENVLDALRMSPGVMVDGSDNISVNGKSGVRFLIDGRATYLSGDQLKEYLRSISVENIKAIEIISNPPAKYEAEGTASIINIILKKGTHNGYNGTVYARYIQGIYGNSGLGANLNYKFNNLNLFLNYDNARSVSISDGKELRRYSQQQGNVYFNQSYLERYNAQTNFLRTGLDYKISGKHLVGFIVDGTLVDKDKAYSGRTLASFQDKVDSSFDINNGVDRTFKNLNTNFNYRLIVDSGKKTLDFNYDFSWFNDSQYSDYLTTFRDGSNNYYRAPEVLNGDNPAKVRIHSLKLDYEHKNWLKGELSVGAKLSFIETDNEILFRRLGEDKKWAVDSTRTDHFIYKESIKALYASWSRSFSKWKVQAGMRFEHTSTKGNSVVLSEVVNRNYFQFFPSLFIVRDLDDRNQLNLSYSRRIGRPDYSSLNPFEFYFDPYSYKKGNPYLNPELSNSMELAYTLDGNYAFTLAYVGSKDVISDISLQNDTTRVLEYTYANLRTQHNYSANISAPVDVAKWWNIYTNVTAYLNVFDSKLDQGLLYKKQWSYTAYLSNTFTVSKSTTAQLTLYYMSPFVRGINNFESLYNVSAGVRKTFWNRRLSVSAKVTDLFLRQREKGRVDFLNQYIVFSQFHDSRRCAISLSYNFNGGTKFKVRDREVGNEAEKNRVSQ